MIEQADPRVTLSADIDTLTLRQLQKEAIRPLFVLTGVAGLALFISEPQFPLLWRNSVLGLGLMLTGLLAYMLVSQRYLAAAWLLLLGWSGGIVALLFRAPAGAALCLLALPVGLATLFISVRAGLALGAGASLTLLAFRLGLSSVVPEGWPLAAVLIWGVFLLARCAAHPTETAINWSWQSYAEARRQLELARDRQGELNQAVKDLAEANLQMARLNQLLGAARRAAEEAERVKAEFVANVSHELRTPLNMIIGFAEMILDAPSTYADRLPSTLLADVAAIRRNSEHLASLINDVLDVSQIEARRMSLNKEWLSLAEIIEAAMLAVRPLYASRGLCLRADLPPDLPPVHGDRTRIRQVLLNLLSNAGRFTERGGVTIEAKYDEQEVTISVTDTGPGIAEADLPRIFEPFRQLDGSLRRRQGGSGLGLNISRRFIDLHGGRMGVQSQVGVGSTFWFTLPCRPPDSDRLAATRWLSEWEPRRRSRLTPRPQLVPRLVILEPEDLLQEAARRYLDGVEVEGAATPAQARELLTAGPAQALLVRGRSSLETEAWVEDLQNTPYQAPVIACTMPACTPESRLGVAGYLMKPITRAQLLEAVAAVGTEVRTILLVDDEPEALQLFTRLLAGGPQHYRVWQAASGRQALDLLRERRPDLMLLDLVMPGMDGFAVLAEKNRDPALAAVPVLILSATDPSGQPIGVSSFTATYCAGLSLPQFLRCSLAISEVLAVPRPGPDSASRAAPGE